MPKYAKLKDNLVENIIEADESFVSGDSSYILVATDQFVDIGYSYTDNEFIPSITWDDIRNTRDNLLKSSDFAATVDYYNSLTSEQQTELVIYRQALRDITDNFSSANLVEYPTIPSFL